MIDDNDCEAISGMNEWEGKLKYSVKTYAHASLSATDPTYLDLGSKAGQHGGKPASNPLSYRTDIWHDTLLKGRMKEISSHEEDNSLLTSLY
jgi:hypothetical protein